MGNGTSKIADGRDVWIGGVNFGPSVGYTDELAPNGEFEGWQSGGEDEEINNAVETNDSEYQYRDLKEPGWIRLLVLLPGQYPKGPPECQLRNVKLDASPEFEALSYTWGEPTFPNRIGIGGKELHITKNLYDALRSLRFADRPRILWVDAVCINQNNEMEKGIQVGMMASIYQRAHRVVIWLGDDDDGNALAAFEAAAKLHRLARNLAIESLEPPRAEGPKRGTLLREAALERMLENHKADLERALPRINTASLMSLLKRDWFSRTWTIQEITLANSAVVQSGHRYISWDVLATSVHILINGISFKDPSGATLISRDKGTYLLNAWACVQARFMDVWRTRIDDAFGSVESAPIQQILPYLLVAGQAYSFRIRGCGDDRDRIFALVSLWPQHLQLEFKPDYSRSVEEVYTEFARSALRAGTLDILKFAGLWFIQPSHLASSSNHSSLIATRALPSWVPEFRLSRLPFLDKRLNHFGVLFDFPWVCAESEYSYDGRDMRDSIPESGPKIFISGRIIDKVSAASFGSEPQNPDDHPVVEWLAASQDIFQAAAVDDDYQPTGEPNEEAFARTILADGPVNIGNLGDEDITPQLNDPLDQLVAFITEPDHDNAGEADEEQRDHYVGTITRIHSLCAFFVTEQVFIGLAPHNTAPGDLAVTFDGLRWPFLLRPVQGTDEYELVGQCYVHGFMRGENAASGEKMKFCLV